MSLDHLWAAWRSAYVSAVTDDDDTATGSVFTRILAAGLPDSVTHVVWRGTGCFAILNAFPYTSGHMLVMPFREVPGLDDLTAQEFRELWEVVRDAVAAVRAAYRCDGVNVGMNLGKAAGAGVPGHLHVHVLPRWAGDTNFMTTVAGARVMPESLDESAARLTAAWPSGGRDA